MANKESIAQQVAQLSQEQQDKILKVGRIALTLQLIVGIPWLIVALFGVWTLIDPPMEFVYYGYDKLYMRFMTWIAVGAVYLIGVVVFVKIKYPYYSDAKWKYINKARKGK